MSRAGGGNAPVDSTTPATRAAMKYLPSILALLIAIAGWFYMFYSRAAQNLADFEDQRLNQRRIRLRRIGGAAMFLMAIAFYAGCETIDPRQATRAFILTWVLVTLMMVLILALAMVDMRLTLRLRRRHKP
jgi:Na+/H+ antiporter NhaD/arsenite permease-like protein